jgi:N6-adenosine-specific RNA methylase IME4
MPAGEIAALPVGPLAADDCHLHLWTTNAFLADGLKVMNAWGFTFKSVFVWAKPQLGMGNYWRVSHEFLLLGTRGRCRFRDRGQPSWRVFGRTRHSAKPAAVRRLVEAVSPGPYLELFGRSPAPGWAVWGNEVGSEEFDAAVAAARGVVKRLDAGPASGQRG